VILRGNLNLVFSGSERRSG